MREKRVSNVNERSLSEQSPRRVFLQEILDGPRGFMEKQRIIVSGYPQLSVVNLVPYRPENTERFQIRRGVSGFAAVEVYVMRPEAPRHPAVQRKVNPKKLFEVKTDVAKPWVTFYRVFRPNEKREDPLPHDKQVTVSGVISGTVNTLHINEARIIFSEK